MITVFLVRHGESQANAGFATPDPGKVELASLGEKQANEVATFLKEHTPLNFIVTSPYLRTKRTAESTKLLFPTADVEEWEVQECTTAALLTQFKHYLISMNQSFVANANALTRFQLLGR